jgi:diguanylate cyclase (GGDEF)-like protein
MANALCQALVEMGLPHEQSPFSVVTASVGVAVLVPKHGQPARALVKSADEALYRAKAHGRNQAMLAGAVM